MNERRTRWASAIKRSALAGLSGYGMRMSLMPASANHSASPMLAQQMPAAPRSICQRATIGLLWVLAWGRIRMPRADAAVCMRSMVRSARNLSMSTAGVPRSVSVTLPFCHGEHEGHEGHEEHEEWTITCLRLRVDGPGPEILARDVVMLIRSCFVSFVFTRGRCS